MKRGNCSGVPHDLIVIYRDGNDMEERVVRWCINCGAVVIDTDYDGRGNEVSYEP